MNKNHRDPHELDLTKPRLASYKQKCKRHQDTVYWFDKQLAQRKEYQTRSNALILYNTLPAYCVPMATKMETGEIIYEKVFESPRPPPKISFRHNWMKELGSEVAGQAESSQPTQPKTPNPIDTRFSLDCESTNSFVERLEKDKDTDKDVDADRDRTGRPVGGHWSSQLEEIDIDFRVSGLPHEVVKQAEKFRVRELVKKIESHPHRRDLQADLQQSNAYNPFIVKSKKIR